MPGPGDDVAAKIESQVRDAIMKMVGDIRSSIDDVRDVVVQQLQAAMQSVQADANALSLKPQLQAILRDSSPAAPAAPPAPVANVGDVKRAIQAVERGANQVEVLNALLDQSLRFGSRAALLILKGDTFAGWKGVGFSASGGSDDSVKRFSAAASSLPELDRAYRQETVVAWNGSNLASKLGASAPQQALLIPMVIKDKVAAAVYVDAAERGKLNQGALEMLVFTTGLLIDTLGVRKKIPSPSLSQEAGETAGAAAAIAFPEPEPAKPPASRVAPPAPPRAAPPAAPPRRSFEVEPPAAAPPGRRPAAVPAPDFATTAIPAFTPPAAPPAPAARPAAAAPNTAVADLSERASTQYIPPAGVKPAGRFGAAQPEDTKKHDEARRFARLLVSEIKLYNESKVDQGRRNKDIYERLKEDIDRSRQMYDERVPENVRKSSNYFYDELVRILADGDTDALGL